MRFKVLSLQIQNSFLAFSISRLLLQFAFKLLALLALGVKLSVSIFFLCLKPLRLLTDLSLELFAVHLDPILVPGDGPLELCVEISGLLLSE